VEVLIVASDAVGWTLKDVHLAFSARSTHVSGWAGLCELAENGTRPFDAIVVEGSVLTVGPPARRVFRALHRIAPRASLLVFTHDPDLAQLVRKESEHRDTHVLTLLPGDEAHFTPYLGHAVQRLLRDGMKSPAP
jgi:hypothetical protein